MASRSSGDLHPDLQPLYHEFIAEAAKEGIEVLTTCTYRSNAEQDQLFAQGRTKPGPRVTNARAGQSAHNFTLNGKPAAKAFDVVPVVAGKLMWSAAHPHWQTLGKIGMEIGLNWYGAPGSKFTEYPHFQLKA
jgi:peptidoglycan LD-endopeptidase CwlK